MEPTSPNPKLYDRDPLFPERRFLDMVGARVLDPGTAVAVEGVLPRPTAYVGGRLLMIGAPQAWKVIRTGETKDAVGHEWSDDGHRENVGAERG